MAASITTTLESGSWGWEETTEKMEDAHSEPEAGSEEPTESLESAEWVEVREHEAAEKRDRNANPSRQTSIDGETEIESEEWTDELESTEWSQVRQLKTAEKWNRHADSDLQTLSEGEIGWDSSETTEWDQVSEHEATGKQDRHADFDRQTSFEGETKSGWDCSYAEISDSDQIDRSDPPRTPSPDEIRYLDLPFRTKHYFLTYIQRILEQTCARYAREKLSEKLSDLEWKKKFLYTYYGDNGYHNKLVSIDWLSDDSAELESWMRMFAHSAQYTNMPRDAKIMNAVISIRNAAVHRGDCEGFDFEDVSRAMKFPSLVGDSKGESDISAAFRYVMDDSTLDEDTKAGVESAMYTPPPCTTVYQLLGRIQTLLEESCFNYAARKIPQLLEAKGWTIPEQVEIQRWADIFRGWNVQHDASADAFFPAPADSNTSDTDSSADSGFDSDYLVGLIHYVRMFIRNVVAHRSPLWGMDIVQNVHSAIKLCISQSDWQRAIEIEVLAEMYLTKKSRAEVRERLMRGLRNMERCSSRYEEARRIAMAEFLDIEPMPANDDQHSLSPCEESTMEEEDPVPGYWTWSPSMHECLRARKSVE